jgi:hypothetical protein
MRLLSLRGERGNHTNYFLGTAACDCTCECWGSVGIPQDIRETPKSACIPGTLPQDQRVDPNLIALLGLALPEDGAGDGNRTDREGASGAEKQALWRDGESQV